MSLGANYIKDSRFIWNSEQFSSKANSEAWMDSSASNKHSRVQEMRQVGWARNGRRQVMEMSL